jgi:hypothetical protein
MSQYGNGLWAGWYLFQFPAMQHFFLLYNIQTYSGANTASYAMGIWAISPGLKQHGHETDQLTLSSAKAKKSGAVPPLPYMSPWKSA